VRILIVDDLADNCELYATYFRLEGFDVDTAGDGEEALAKVDAAMPDIIVMDLSMPKLDGWETTRRLKSNPRTQGIPIVVLTGLHEELHLARARAAGADFVCLKPCLPSELGARIAETLQRRVTSHRK
jgi:two-component system, cell cycle response regulator DivK